MATLHIVNGSGTASTFKHAQLEGEMLIWNEAMALGPVNAGISSDTFWNMRAQYFDQKNVHTSYAQLMGPELQKVQAPIPYDSINLWFEHDYFCQINMMAVLTWLQHYYTVPSVYLICISEFPGIENFRGLGQLEPKHFRELWPQRVQLNSSDLAYAKAAWEWYSAPSPLNNIEAPCPTVFKYWPRAMRLHLERFPGENGLNKLQSWVLEVISQHNYSFKQLMRHLLLNQSDWGFGDLQYQEIISNLNSCYLQKEPYILNQLGQQVLNNHRHFAYPQVHIGGASSKDYIWHGDKLVASAQ